MNLLSYKRMKFATHWHRAAEDKDIENYIAEHTLLETDAGTLKLSENAVFQEPVGESIYNLYTDVVYIIPDEIAQVLLPVQRNRFVMTQYPLPFKTAEMLEQLLGPFLSRKILIKTIWQDTVQLSILRK